MDFLSDSDQSSLPFLHIAQAALGHYAIHNPQLFFLQHNSGVAFRLDCAPNERYLLKLHLSVNGEDPTSPQVIASRMQWLSDLSGEMGIPVQVPLRNQQDQWITQILDDSGAHWIPCTVQKWLEGDPPGGDFTPDQLIRLGQRMAQLHQYSSQWAGRESAIPFYDHSQLTANIQALHGSVDLGILSEPEFAQIEQAGSTIHRLMDNLGHDPLVWGPIHSDLHHNNVLFYQNDVRVIDFDGLVSSPYIYDLGVTLYHIWYQGPAARQVFLQGYQKRRALLNPPPDWIKTCVAWAAIDNLAFQITIPQQRVSSLFKKNMLQLVHEFC